MSLIEFPLYLERSSNAYGATPLHMAAEKDSSLAIAVLLEKGALKDKTVSFGSTMSFLIPHRSF